MVHIPNKWYVNDDDDRWKKRKRENNEKRIEKGR